MNFLPALALLIAVSQSARADDVSVPNTFTADTTISSSQVNANFDALVQESNENDARLAAAESDVVALTSSVSQPSYTWLGYTSQTFPYDVNTNRASLLTLNNFCKSEFSNNAAQVATTESLAAVSAKNVLPLPTVAALVLPIFSTSMLAGSNANGIWFVDAWGVNGSTAYAGWCQLGISGNFDCNIQIGVGMGNYTVACLTQN